MNNELLINKVADMAGKFGLSFKFIAGDGKIGT